MIRVYSLILPLLFASFCAAQPVGSEYLRTNPKFLLSFRDAIQPASASVVRIQCDGKDTCLGVVIGSDGWVLTKAHDLDGKIICKLKDGRRFEARLVGVHQEHDLAMLRIAATQLRPIALAGSENMRAGSWVASVGFDADPATVGVVSVPTRKLNEAYLGLMVEPSMRGLTVTGVLQNGAAMKAGVRPNDLIVRINGQSFTDSETFAHFLAGHRPGDTLTLSVHRGDVLHDFKAILQNRNDAGGFRADFQNRLGSDLSNRREGYTLILQHDSVLKPTDCGGPLVDLHGRVVGINISRAGRVESWAIPAEVVRQVLAELKSGRLTPKTKNAV